MLNEEEATEPVETMPGQLLMAISCAAWTGNDTSTTFRLQRSIQHHELIVLLDSGSSHTFISDKYCTMLSGITPLERSMTVRVANGQVISCTNPSGANPFTVRPYQDTYQSGQWSSHNKCYQDTSICLQGIVSTFPSGALVELRLLPAQSDASTKQPELHNLAPRIRSILSQFAEVFADPVGLPPSRQCDHAIPLIPGANPFTVRLYRYPGLSKMKSKARSNRCCLRV